MQSDEVPPEYIWEDPEGLERWWASVEEKREDGGSDRVTRASSSTSEDGADGDPGPGMAENDYARFLKQG